MKKNILELFKNYTTFYLYFHHESMYTKFNEVYRKNVYVWRLKLIRCMKLVNSVNRKWRTNNVN